MKNSSRQQQFKAVLVKYKRADSFDFVWFWIHPGTKSVLSPQFSTESGAEQWFNDIITVHEETYDLLSRLRSGSFYIVKCRIDIGDTISSKKANECNFTMHLEDDILEIELLANSIEHARERVEEYFEILEWM